MESLQPPPSDLLKLKCLSLSHVWLFATPWSPPGSSVHRIFQARILEWVTFPFSRGSSWPRDQTRVSCIAGRFFTIWAINHLISSSPQPTVLLLTSLQLRQEPQGTSDFRPRSQGPCRLGPGESGLVLGWGMELRYIYIHTVWNIYIYIQCEIIALSLSLYIYIKVLQSIIYLSISVTISFTKGSIKQLLSHFGAESQVSNFILGSATAHISYGCLMP